ncbi:phosphopantothenoylcysteine decarboxylase [Catellicoccus marimammalium]|uniref:Phosphopantothenoylcysteine synthetase n=1 Tax=Catellicoccus marimammalium M35/04/3 TaxID=1234409 RepID=K8ZMD4_9ENTE|nr:phosphopantothenoylcysteine decarboxylase [Catellicoccus marimammalium]EKU27698.1 Phosphopantothenoylcysteine synthetase [Catellicoccus marimammalium M35/04/3]
MKQEIVLITLGGTSEPIDSVREIRNQATGKLGILCAKKAVQLGYQVIVVVSTTVDSALLESLPSCVQVHRIQGVLDLQTTLKKILEQNTIEIVIHTMAVSDYFVAGAYNQDQQLLQGSKISSDEEVLWLKLEKAPKVIQEIKQWQKDVFLVGFKLLVDATKDELIQKAKAQEVAAKSDLVVINNLSEISETKHQADIVHEGKILATAQTKQELVEQLFSTIAKQRGEIK